MSEKVAQPTIDGKPAPSMPTKKGGRPRKPLAEQTPHLKRERERLRRFREIHPARNAATTRKCRLRLIEMNRLLEWHETCPGSKIFPPSSLDEEIPFDDPSHPPPELEEALLSVPLKSHKLLDHHDE